MTQLLVVDVGDGGSTAREGLFILSLTYFNYSEDVVGVTSKQQIKTGSAHHVTRSIIQMLCDKGQSTRRHVSVASTSKRWLDVSALSHLRALVLFLDHLLSRLLLCLPFLFQPHVLRRLAALRTMTKLVQPRSSAFSAYRLPVRCLNSANLAGCSI